MDFAQLMDIAADRIEPYLPDMFELDDFDWDDDTFQFSVFNCRAKENRNAVGRFRFSRCIGETNAQMMKRFGENVQEFAESWEGYE